MTGISSRFDGRTNFSLTHRLVGRTWVAKRRISRLESGPSRDTPRLEARSPLAHADKRLNRYKQYGLKPILQMAKPLCRAESPDARASHRLHTSQSQYRLGSAPSRPEPGYPFLTDIEEHLPDIGRRALSLLQIHGHEHGRGASERRRDRNRGDDFALPPGLGTFEQTHGAGPVLPAAEDVPSRRRTHWSRGPTMPDAVIQEPTRCCGQGVVRPRPRKQESLFSRVPEEGLYSAVVSNVTSMPDSKAGAPLT